MAHELHATVLAANRDGMDSLKKGQTKAAFDQFKFAETALNDAHEGGDLTDLMAVTCNNLGSYYKKVGKFHGALSYLRRALKMEMDLNTDAVTVAGTHLNICAVLSKLEKHDKALQHALSALELVTARVEAQERAEEVPPDDYQILAIAWHNVAVERDFLQQFDKAAEAFRRGFAVAKKYLGEEHSLTVTLGGNCDAMASKSKMVASSKRGIASPSPVRATRPMATMLPSLPRPPAGDRPVDFSQTAPIGSLALPPLRGGETGTTARSLDLTHRPPRAPRGDILSYNDHDELINGDNMGYSLGKSSKASRDLRPHIMVAGRTRTAKIARRTLGLSVETAHRDKLLADKQNEFKGLAAAKQAYLAKMAVEKIQRSWRAYRQYCEDNVTWMSTTWEAALTIQMKWREHQRYSKKWFRSAITIQRMMRGVLARSHLKKYRAAQMIQKYARGMLTREHIRRKRRSGLKMTALVRGFLARQRVRRRRKELTDVAMRIQRCERGRASRRRVADMRATRNDQRTTIKAATDIQRVFRGWKGRRYFQHTKQRYLREVQEFRAAARIQSQARRRAAKERVEAMRNKKLQQMIFASNCMRKMWLGFKARRRYLELKSQFAKQERHVVTMQRYARGFLVRLRMWREAISAEEELWATLEIQRVWRGYRGRVEWEQKYEEVWRREMSAALIQRHLRGFLGRQEAARRRRKIARAEFEQARLRFRSAQRVQALARGVAERQRFRVRFQRAIWATTTIQRIVRGHQLRRALWKQVMDQRAIVIQANVRGFLGRRRRSLMKEKVAVIQQRYREWQQVPAAQRESAARAREDRKKKATMIQRSYRARRESREVGRIQASPGADARPGS